MIEARFWTWTLTFEQQNYHIMIATVRGTEAWNSNNNSTWMSLCFIIQWWPWPWNRWPYCMILCSLYISYASYCISYHMRDKIIYLHWQLLRSLSFMISYSSMYLYFVLYDTVHPSVFPALFLVALWWTTVLLLWMALSALNSVQHQIFRDRHHTDL